MDGLFQELVSLVPLIVLLSLRVGVAIATLPAPFGSGAPTQVRAVLGVLIASVLALPNRRLADDLVLDPYFFAFAALGELVIGASLALVARVPMLAADAAGDLVGSAMGLGFAHTMDPASGEQTLVPATLLSMAATLLFFGLGGHHALLVALSFSTELVPPGHLFDASVAMASVEVGAEILGRALRIGSPVIGTMFVVQLAVGLVARAAPKLQIFSLSFGTAATVGMLTLLVALPSSIEAIAQMVRGLPDLLFVILGGQHG